MKFIELNMFKDKENLSSKYELVEKIFLKIKRKPET